MSFPRARKNLGDSSERVAALYLEQRGYRILARDVQTRLGQLDLVAEQEGEIVFVEVKARRGSAFGSPEEAITPRKQIKLAQLAEAFFAANRSLAARPWRIDVVAIHLDRGGKVQEIHLIQNAVQF